MSYLPRGSSDRPSSKCASNQESTSLYIVPSGWRALWVVAAAPHAQQTARKRSASLAPNASLNMLALFVSATIVCFGVALGSTTAPTGNQCACALQSAATYSRCCSGGRSAFQALTPRQKRPGVRR
jgi:hypothetical protein